MQAISPFPRLGRMFRVLGFQWSAVVLVSLGCLLFAAGPASNSGSGKISVATQPAGATVYVDGQVSGKTPTEIEGLGAGRYFLRLELEGYRAADLVVELAAGQSYQSGPIELTSNSAPPPRRVETPPVAARPVPATPVPATPVPRAPVASIPPPAIPAPATPTPAPSTPPARELPRPADVLPVPSADASATGDDAIQRLVTAHLRSITDGDIDGYLRLCAPKVDLYDEGVQTQETIRKSRQKLKERWPTYAISNVRDLSVRAGDRPEMRRAAVTYDWNVSNPKTGKSASGTASDLLDFKQTDGQWLIVKARQNVERSKKRGQ